MLQKFLSKYHVTDRLELAGESGWQVPREVEELFHDAAGCTFNNGLYRVHTPRTAAASTALCSRMIDGLAGRIYCFAFDWLGRNLALEFQEGAEPLVIIVEPGAGEHMESEATIREFHEEVVVEDPTALAEGLFQEWCAAHPGFGGLPYDECVGYRVPLFLGGEDELENLEKAPYDVYWEICVQLRTGVRRMRAGSSIGRIIQSPEEVV